VRLVRADDRVFGASIVDHAGPAGTGRTPKAVLFGPDADAACQTTDHESPAVGCRCGFWSVGHRIDLAVAVGPRLRGWALAEVELSGTVIETERGFRAQHQRILSVVVADRCEHPRCVERTRGLAADPHGFLRAACRAHGGTLTPVDASGMLRTEVRLGVLPPAATDLRPAPTGGVGGLGLTWLAALAGAASVVALAVRGADTATAGASATALAAVIGVLTGLGVALRSRSRVRRDERAPLLDTLATLAALTTTMVSVTAVLTATTAGA